MLRWRLIFGISIIAALALLCWFDANATRPGIILAPVAIVICILATEEVMNFFIALGKQPIRWACYVGTLLPVLFSCVPLAWAEYPEDCPIGKIGWLLFGVAAGLFVALVGEMLRYKEPGQTLNNLTPVVFSVTYVGMLLAFLIQLRIAEDGKLGMLLLLSLIGTVKLSDTCQYTFGNLFGKHKLAPDISPGKTWEGTVYGIAAAVLIAGSLFTYLLRNLGHEQNLLTMYLYALLIAVAGIIGDLAESMLKRDSGVKDSSSWLPGLGGILDILDSLLVAAPVAFFCWAAGLIGA